MAVCLAFGGKTKKLTSCIPPILVTPPFRAAKKVLHNLIIAVNVLLGTEIAETRDNIDSSAAYC